MKKLIGTILCTLTFLALLVSLAVPALATPAEAPEWAEGDKWAYGMEANAGEDLDQELENLTAMIDDALNDLDGIEADLNDLNMAGNSEIWILFEITEANDDFYVLSMDMAAMMTIDAGISITAELPVEGTYAPEDLITAEREEITMSAALDFEMVLTVSVDVTFESDTMALQSVEISIKLTGNLDLSADNLPIWLIEMMGNDTDLESMTGDIKVEYEDYDISADLELNLAMDLEFVPALNMWDFPLDQGDEWNVSSNATLSGSMTGSLDASGLPSELEDALFEEISDDIGVDSFPIIFEDLEFEDNPFENGELEETTEHIGPIALQCTDVFMVDDPYWNDITVYEINVEGTPLNFYYSPDVGFMSHFSMNMNDLDEGMPNEDVMIEAVDPDVAEDNIAEISDRQGEVDEEGGMLGFFTDAPYLGIILVAVIVVVVVAAVFLIRKK